VQRPELTAEIKAKAGVDFYLYAPDRFMHFAQKYLDQAIEQSTIEELKEVREQKPEGGKLSITTELPALDPNIIRTLLSFPSEISSEHWANLIPKITFADWAKAYLAKTDPNVLSGIVYPVVDQPTIFDYLSPSVPKPPEDNSKKEGN